MRILDAACGRRRVDQKNIYNRNLTASRRIRVLSIYLVLPEKFEFFVPRFDDTEINIKREYNFQMQFQMHQTLGSFVATKKGMYRTRKMWSFLS